MSAFLRFVVVGAIAVTIQLVSFAVLHRLGLPNLVAGTAAYWLGTAAHFLLNRRFTFRSQSRVSTPQVVAYGGLLVLNYMITLICIWITTTRLALPGEVGIVASLCITVIISFFYMQRVVFAGKSA